MILIITEKAVNTILVGIILLIIVLMFYAGVSLYRTYHSKTKKHIEFTKEGSTHTGYITDIDGVNKTCTVCSVEYGVEIVPFKYIKLK